ncbi:MAG: DUF3800 domain-containing protein [Rhodopirellula sp.]|nr:DUF3800 domain-containing protein [Rhodopirellula sp.]
MKNPEWAKLYNQERAIQKILAGDYFGVFIDDTGSPGMANTPAKLHPNRKSWVAVVVPPTQVLEVTSAINGILQPLRGLGVKECHCVDIYSGKGPFRKELPSELRTVLLQFFADVLYLFDIAIYVQTFDPENYAKLFKWPRLPKIASCFDMHRHEDAALWFLLIRVRDHLLANRTSNGQRAMVFVDEGMKKAGTRIEVDVFDDVFLDGHLLFASSAAVPLLQLADYAAFCINRVQLIARKEKRSDFDIAFLEMMEPLAGQFRNCTLKVTWPNRDGPMVP